MGGSTEKDKPLKSEFESSKKSSYIFSFPGLNYIQNADIIFFSTKFSHHYVNEENKNQQGQTSINDINNFKEIVKSSFRSIVRMTYRSNFRPLLGLKDGYRTDSGWGCVIRCGQMMIANSLIRHIFKVIPFDYEILLKIEEERNKYINVIQLFHDNVTGQLSPFSIQNIAIEGIQFEKKPGDWYGPCTIIQILEQLNQKFPIQKSFKIPNFHNISIMAFPQGQIDLNKLETELYYGNNDQSNSNPKEIVKKWKGSSLILLVGSRLGINKINLIYLKEIFRLMKMYSFNGLLAARKDKAFFFIGSQEYDLIFLDPHKVQKSVESFDGMNFQDCKSYQSKNPKKFHISELEPTLAFCFYCYDEQEYLEMIKDFQTEKGEQVFISLHSNLDDDNFTFKYKKVTL